MYSCQFQWNFYLIKATYFYYYTCFISTNSTPISDIYKRKAKSYFLPVYAYMYMIIKS